MDLPHSATGDVGRAAVLIPLRSLGSGKARLGDVLTLSERVVLIETMAERVISAAHDLDVLVVHDDPNVEMWATGRGAMAIQAETPGLNNAITEGREYLRAAGYSRLIIAHADLPYAADLRVMLTAHEISIAPDRHRDGTNVPSLSTTTPFDFAYGPGSFENHVQIARDRGIEPFVVDLPGLSWNIDHPDDLPDDLTDFGLAHRQPSEKHTQPRGRPA